MLELMVDRCQTQIDVEKICYIEVKDKLCTIHMEKGKQIQIFISISKLEQMLGGEEFVRISRCYLVPFRYVDRIQKKVILQNGESLSYSARRKSQLMKKYYHYMQEKYARVDMLKFQKKYEPMWDFPVALLVLKVEAIRRTYSSNIMVVYGNAQAGKLLNKGDKIQSGENLSEYLWEEENRSIIDMLRRTAYEGDVERVSVYCEKNTQKHMLRGISD